MNINSKCTFKHQAGVTLIELMIALAIGAVLLIGLATVFINSSSSRRELEKSSALIENGRYAISILADDLSLAGYYGFYNDIGDAPATLPDPCALTSASLLAAIPQPLQGYRAANLTTVPDIDTTNTCEASLLTNANLTQGSDILIIRRADTAVSGAMTSPEVYLEANARTAEVLISTAATGLLRSPNKAGSPAADIRKLHVHTYFIAPCSRGSGANGVCQVGDDGIPTLKRLAFHRTGAIEIEPLVEGIEYMKLEYGIDTSPSSINAITGLAGDGIPDSYVTSPTTAQWASVVSVRVYILARAPRASDGHNDTKAYVLGSTNIAATNDQFKRHVYSAEVRPTNVAGRREIPE